MSLPPIKVGICPMCVDVILHESGDTIVRHCAHSETLQYYSKRTCSSIYRDKVLPPEAEALASKFAAVTEH